MHTIEDIEVVRPGGTDYERVRHVYSAKGSPATVLLPRTPGETARSLAFARNQGGPLAVRSGGHGISSIATNNGGVVIDLRRLNGVDHLGGATVLVGPGARWSQVAHGLGDWGLALTSGDSGDVGVGGLATTGGIGLLGRLQGLTVDRMRAADIVTADGRLVRASPEEHPDLFWAVRGAGANIGIVTSFEFEAGMTPVVAQATFAYEMTDAAAFLRSWGDVVEAAPREVSAFLYVGAGARPFAQATVVFASDDANAASAALEPFTRLRRLAGQRAGMTAYANVPLTSGAPHSGQQGAAMHSGLADHLDEAVSGGLAELLASGRAEMVQIRSAGGAINDVAADATAYAHRHQNFSVTAVSTRPGPAFDDAWAPVRATLDGLYLSFESTHRAADVEAAFPPATLARLQRIKKRWDPDDVFSQNFDVSPAGASPR
ncbi:FAD-binding oxidoreductase [Microbacterium sp. P01]|uniref:FAD-binding oxidoreductase n=1 Tax=Microbacterium sp. P01 TaxID=3366261 RepID=UPI00366EB431